MTTVNRRDPLRLGMSRSCETAVVPGHVTGFFSAHPATRAAAAGSRGAGVTLSTGVTVTVTPTDAATSLALNGEPTSVGAVADVLDALGVRARVEMTTDLPVGAGFGVSGAAALGAAMAANAAADCGRSENDLVRIAHEADVERGTGLGDVVAQARGGVPLRLEPGAPQYGSLDGIPASPRVEYVSFGPLSTADVLAGDTDRLSAAGTDALDRVTDDPRLETFMAASRAFAERANLLSPPVERAIDAVLAAGGSAAMAMLGQTVFALETGLSDAGYDPHVCRTHPSGARLLRDDSAADESIAVQ
jgi:pantoate kinase